MILVLTQKLGQTIGPNLGGVHNESGQTKGQTWKPTRGVERYKAWRLGTTVEVKNHHQRVVFGCRPADAGAKGALQLTLEGCGAHHKICKNQLNMETWRPAGGVLILKSTSSKTHYKIQNKSCYFWDFCQMENFDFLCKLLTLTFLSFGWFLTTEYVNLS